MTWAWELGAILTVLGSIGINLGTNLMKLGYMTKETLDTVDDIPVWRFWQWQTGMLMFVIGNTATFVARGFASQSLLTGLGSVQFISNLVFVMLVLKEKVLPRCMLATFFIVVGNVILVVFGNKASPKYSVSELADLYRKDGMAAYMIMAYAGVVPLAYTVYLYGQQTKKLMPEKTFAWWSKLLPVLYSLFSSILGAHAVLFATSMCIILVDMIEGRSVFGQWYTYLVVVGIVAMSIFWVGQLDKGLLLFPAVGIIPASAVKHIDVRPKRSSFAAMTQAGKEAKKRVFQSAANTATLTAGLSRNKQLRALTIFAMPMIMPNMAFASQRQSSEHAGSPRIGIEAVYNRVSRLLSADVGPAVPRQMFENIQPAAHLSALGGSSA